MDDLIARLRRCFNGLEGLQTDQGDYGVLAEAAAALTEAQAEIERLRGALELAIGLGRDLGMTDMEEDVIRAAALNTPETAPPE